MSKERERWKFVFSIEICISINLNNDSMDAMAGGPVVCVDLFVDFLHLRAHLFETADLLWSPWAQSGGPGVSKIQFKKCFTLM